MNLKNMEELGKGSKVPYKVYLLYLAPLSFYRFPGSVSTITGTSTRLYINFIVVFSLHTPPTQLQSLLPTGLLPKVFIFPFSRQLFAPGLVAKVCIMTGVATSNISSHTIRTFF